MKKIISMLCIICCMCLLIPVAAADGEIKVLLDGKKLKFDVPPQIIDGRTMVPLRTIFEELGAEIDWDADTKTVAAIKDETYIVATVDSNIMYINDEEEIMDVPPMIIDSRTLVPVRFISKALGCEVSWDGASKTVKISSAE